MKIAYILSLAGIRCFGAAPAFSGRETRNIYIYVIMIIISTKLGKHHAQYYHCVMGDRYFEAILPVTCC